MNIFVIPAWYPSTDFPLTGIFVKEQLEGICYHEGSVNIGVSLWGQLDKRYLLWIKDHFLNFQKISVADTRPFTKTILPNFREYHQPAYTWTRKLLHGNRKGMLNSTLANYSRFEEDFGKVDLIHAHVGEVAGQLAMELSRIRGVPYLITEHMGPFPGPFASDSSGNLKKAYLKPYMGAAANIATSPFQEQEMQRQGIPDTVVIPNFVNENFFKPVLHQPAQSFRFFSLARLAPDKGIDQLLCAVKELVNKRHNFHIRIGGNGSHSHAFKQLAEQLGISGHIHWLGELTREEALQEYQECHAFVLPSRYETFGIVYAEAIACGKPIIATKCGGPESLVNCTNGLLVEKDDAAGLASAMQKMMENYDQYNNNRIRQDFMERFSTAAVVPKLVTLYKDIITKYSRSNS